MKILINRCFGGFGISDELREKLGHEKQEFFPGERKGSQHYWTPGNHDLSRTDPELIQAVEELGVEKSSDRFAELEVIEIPDGVQWEINEYDGRETVVWSEREMHHV